MHIVAAASSLYLKNLRALMTSCGIWYPRADFTARLINVSSQDTQEIKEEYPAVNFISVTYDDDTTRKHLCANGALFQDKLLGVYDEKRTDFKGARWLYSDFMARSTNDRYQIVIDLLEQGAECVLSIDADTIIRGDLTELKTNILQHDIALHGEIVKDGKAIDFGNTILYNEIPIFNRDQYKQKEYIPNNPQYVEWHTGVAGFNNTPTSLEFVKEYCELLSKPENIHKWGAEEEEIYFLYLKYHERLKVYNIPIKFKDEGYGTQRRVGTDQYNPDSCIWVGAGQNKYNCTKFSKEVDMYSSFNRPD